MITASAPAKVILLGEHTALYGNPVIAAAVDLRSTATVSKRLDRGVALKSWPSLGGSQIRKNRGMEMVRKAAELAGAGFDVRVQSSVPIGSGLGSSASISSALCMAMMAEASKHVSLRDVALAAWKCEDLVHGKSSGVDPFAVTFGGVSLYQSGKLRAIKCKPDIVIAHSGIARNTGDIVKDLEEMKRAERERFDKFLKESKRIVEDGRVALERSDFGGLGRLMDENHELLKGIGVSCKELDGLVKAAREAGALGAKLSGAGRGGIMVALVDEGSKKAVVKALSNLGGKIIEAGITGECARLE